MRGGEERKGAEEREEEERRAEERRERGVENDHALLTRAFVLGLFILDRVVLVLWWVELGSSCV